MFLAVVEGVLENDPCTLSVVQLEIDQAELLEHVCVGRLVPQNLEEAFDSLDSVGSQLVDSIYIVA